MTLWRSVSETRIQAHCTVLGHRQGYGQLVDRHLSFRR